MAQPRCASLETSFPPAMLMMLMCTSAVRSMTTSTRCAWLPAHVSKRVLLAEASRSGLTSACLHGYNGSAQQ